MEREVWVLLHAITTLDEEPLHVIQTEPQLSIVAVGVFESEEALEAEVRRRSEEHDNDGGEYFWFGDVPFHIGSK